MGAYLEFAQVYDEFMDNVDYNEWCSFAIKLLKKNGMENCNLVEIGCGTGSATMLFAKAGYSMTGIDISQEMLEIAMDKKTDENIIYVLQDATELELPCKVPAMVSVGDSMNYITEYEDIVKVFKQVKKYLEDGGVFVFDLKTRKYFSDIGDSVIAEDREDNSFIWENYFDEETSINEYYLSIFVQGDDGRYDKFEEQHYQKGYTLDEIKTAVAEAGLTVSEIYEAFTDNVGSEQNDRVYFIVKNGEK